MRGPILIAATGGQARRLRVHAEHAAARPLFYTEGGARPGNPPGRPIHSHRRGYLGCGTIRRYGRGAFQPCGYVFFASSSDTEPAMITSSPCFQFTGVATLCFAVSCSESTTRSTSSKLRPVVIGYAMMSLIFLSGPMTNTLRTV